MTLVVSNVQENIRKNNAHIKYLRNLSIVLRQYTGDV